MESWRTEEPQPVEWGYGLAASYGIVLLGISISNAGVSFLLDGCTQSDRLRAVYEMQLCKLQAQIRAVLAHSVYRKSLKLHISEAEDVGSGALSSYESVDIERIIQAMKFPYLMLHVCIAISIAIYLLSIEMGATAVSAVVSILVLACAVPIFGRHLVADMLRWSSATDSRVKLLGSILRCWPSIKCHHYEKALFRMYEGHRHEELQEQKVFKRRSASLNAFTVGVCHSSSLLIARSSLGVHSCGLACELQ